MLQQPRAAAAGSYYGPLDPVFNPLEQNNNHAAPTHPALVNRDVRMALDWQEMGQDDAPAQQQVGQGFPGAATIVGEVDINGFDFNDIDFGALFEPES